MEEQIRTNEDEFVWNTKELKKRNWKNVFKRGLKSYAIVVLTVFLFSFIGTNSILSSSFVRIFDKVLGLGPVDYDKVERVGDYIAELPVIKDWPDNIRHHVRYYGMTLTIENKNLLNILEMNHAYVERNMGEVVAFLIVGLLIFYAVIFLLKKTLVAGHKRFYMERRFSGDVKLRRTIAPFGGRTIARVIKTMVVYNIIMKLWALTIIGVVIKTFEYYCVPCIVAENPKVTWKEARDLSSAMTKGYRWKLFAMHLSCLPYYIVGLFPFGHLLFTEPLVGNLHVEAYLKLRSRRDIDRRLFIEDAFDGKAYVDRLECGERPEDINPEFKLEEFEITGSSFDENDRYSLYDFIALFFLFSFVGWVWEVLLHVYKDHGFVNRGFMYGPWLPIYGFGGAFIILLLSKYKNNKPKLFGMTMLLCGTLEYLTSFALDYFQNSQYWDYKQMFMNVNGRICLAGLIAFAIGGFVGVYILGPFTKRMLELLGMKKTRILCIVLIAVFIADLSVCVIKGPNTGKGIGSEYNASGVSEAV